DPLCSLILSAPSPANPTYDPPSLHDALPISFGSSQVAISRGCGTSVSASAASTRVSRSITALLRGRRCFGPRRSTYDRPDRVNRSEEHTSELQSRFDIVCRLLLVIQKPSLRS